ncbi:MAG: WYL domain-containing protein [Actinobacteria bacterium]|nr:WYL domain-containing protein [Actinomycetota bacterium]
MADKKTERLINLTLALLASKRYLRKHEIFASVAGYSGELASMERMFERDKSDLRLLGIDIEVGDIDPLFEDEPGYRIIQSEYELSLPELSPSEIALISLAGNLWNDSILAPSAQSGIRKLESLGIPAAMDLNLQIQYRFENPGTDIELVRLSIEEKRQIEFIYESKSTKSRKVNPYQILLWKGFWYLLGEDISDKAIKLFKFARINGSVQTTGKGDSFKIPEGLNPAKFLPDAESESSKAKVSIRAGEAQLLRRKGELISNLGDVDIFEISYVSESMLLHEILWHGSSVELLEPEHLREDLIDKLKKLSNE